MTGELTNREFIGIVLPDKDLLHQGRYKVNVPGLQPHMKQTKGIWCKNHTCKYRVSPSDHGIVGSYYPLHPGMVVVVKFFANHIESAYVDRVISDSYAETLPYEIIERDDYYQILRTPRYNNLIAIYEGPPPPGDSGTDEPWTPANSQSSKNVPRNSIHIYFNDTRTTVVIDETGINVKTEDNINMTVAKNVKVTVLGSADINATGHINVETADAVNVKATGNINVESFADTNIKTIGNGNVNIQAAASVNVKAGGDADIEASGNVNMKGAVVNIEASGVMNLKAGGIIHMQALAIDQNGVAGPASGAGSAGSADSAVLADDPVLIIPREDYKYFGQNTGK